MRETGAGANIGCDSWNVTESETLVMVQARISQWDFGCLWLALLLGATLCKNLNFLAL